jgi:hypothetical protein
LYFVARTARINEQRAGGEKSEVAVASPWLITVCEKDLPLYSNSFTGAVGLATFSTRETFAGRRAAESKAVIRWLQRTMEVLQSACGSEDFFLKAAQAVVDIVGLDSGQVVLLENGAWRTQAYRAGQSQTADGGASPSRSILGLVLRDKRTFWELTHRRRSPYRPETLEGPLAAPGRRPRRVLLGESAKVAGIRHVPS